jgi:hypothetical protein
MTEENYSESKFCENTRGSTFRPRYNRGGGGSALTDENEGVNMPAGRGRRVSTSIKIRL